jgi:hypothetical protein
MIKTNLVVLGVVDMRQLLLNLFYFKGYKGKEYSMYIIKKCEPKIWGKIFFSFCKVIINVLGSSFGHVEF